MLAALKFVTFQIGTSHFVHCSSGNIKLFFKRFIWRRVNLFWQQLSRLSGIIWWRPCLPILTSFSCYRRCGRVSSTREVFSSKVSSSKESSCKKLLPFLNILQVLKLVPMFACPNPVNLARVLAIKTARLSD